MAVTSTPRSTHGSMGQVSGFSQLTPHAMAGLGDEVQEDVIDDADGGEKEQNPGERGGGPPPEDGVPCRTGLQDDAAEPGGGERKLNNPRARHPAEHAWITTVGQAKA